VDSRGFFAPTKGVYRQNDFGGSIGGPIWIPKAYNGRNRTFFFVAYEGFRNRQGSPGVIFSVPTPEMYQGDFTNLVNSKNQQIPIYDTASTRVGYDSRSVPGKHHSRPAFQRDLQSVPCAGEIRVGAQPCGDRARDDRLYQQ
jgi:hypothetical protein